MMKYVGCGLATMFLALACSGEDATQLSVQEQATLEVAPEVGGVPSVPPGEQTQPISASPLETAPAAAEPELPAGPVGPPESIFAREHVIEVRVEMSLEDWEALSFEGIGMREILFPETGFRQVPPYTRFTASVSVDGVPYENVSIRKKGYIGSLSVIRPSLKLDFSRNFELPLAGGMRRMTLNNDLQDPSHVKQCLSYDLFAEIGLPASRCNYAHVVVNGVDLGTYSHVEDVAKPMLARHFEDVDGNLYEGELADFNAETAEYLELQTNEEENDRSDVQAVISALAESDEQLVEALGSVVDLDNFFDFWALETLLGHWDGYASNANNYFAYHDPTTDKLFFIPWGTDQSFVGDNPNDARPYDVSVYASGAIANRLYALPEQRARYRARLGQLADELWQVPALLTRVEQLSRLAARSSPAELTRLRNYVRNHGDDVRAALQLPAPEWPEPAPAQPGDACQGSAGALSGSFTTQWGNIDDVLALSTNGSSDFEVSIEVDGAPFAGAFRGRAGESGFTPGAATLRMLAPRPDGFYVVVELNLPLELFEPGYHPLHSFESSGNFGMFHPAFGGPFRFGPIGDGGVQLDRVSMEPGGTVSGSFTGIINYYLCTETLTGFFPPLPAPGPPPEAPPVVDEAGDSEDPEDTALAEEATEGLAGSDPAELQASTEDGE